MPNKKSKIFYISRDMNIFNINSKGQFFSPDILIAVLVFLLGLFLFINASTFVFSQVNLFEERTNADNVAHATMDALVKTGGLPINWNDKNFNETRFFGLSKSENEIDKNKLITLINYLDNNYEITKEKLGLGDYDFYLKLIDFNGSTTYSSTNFSTNTKRELVYSRIVYFDGKMVTIQGVVVDD